MKRLSWELVQQFYMNNFGLDGWLVELYANQDILLLCASGTSNAHISEFTEIPQDEVVRVLKNTLDFEGWSEDLPSNPYKLYSDTMNTDLEVKRGSFISTLQEDFITYQSISEKDALSSYNVCKTVWEIESKIKDEWI